MREQINILIVDDNPAVRVMMRSYLQEMADEIRECEDGADAFQAYYRFRPDWVLMDWEMKKLDGLKATREITLAFPDAKVIMFTQYDDPELRAAANEAGAFAFVSKDDLATLLEILRPPVLA